MQAVGEPEIEVERHAALAQQSDRCLANRNRALGDRLEKALAELDRPAIVRPEDVPRNVVTMNSTVVLRDLDTKEKETYTLVFPDAADIANDRLSVLAPVGTAILGERVGDVVRWRVPQGWRRLKVERVVYQPEREGAYHA